MKKRRENLDGIDVKQAKSNSDTDEMMDTDDEDNFSANPLQFDFDDLPQHSMLKRSDIIIRPLLNSFITTFEAPLQEARAFLSPPNKPVIVATYEFWRCLLDEMGHSDQLATIAFLQRKYASWLG